MILQIKQMQQHISSVQLSRCVGCHTDLSVADKLALASSLLQYYDHGHSFNRDIQHTEFAWVWDMYSRTSIWIIQGIEIVVKCDFYAVIINININHVMSCYLCVCVFVYSILDVICVGILCLHCMSYWYKTVSESYILMLSFSV